VGDIAFGVGGEGKWMRGTWSARFGGGVPRSAEDEAKQEGHRGIEGLRNRGIEGFWREHEAVAGRE